LPGIGHFHFALTFDDKTLFTEKKIVYSISGRGINQITNSEMTLTEEAEEHSSDFQSNIFNGGTFA